MLKYVLKNVGFQGMYWIRILQDTDYTLITNLMH